MSVDALDATGAVTRQAISVEEDVVKVRKLTREHAVNLGFSLTEQTKLVTAASELARNTLDYGRGGEALVEVVLDGPKVGVQLRFVDHGPGIDDIERALREGYSSGTGLGLGLSGAKRLADEFALQTTPGEGTTVTITKWKRR